MAVFVHWLSPMITYLKVKDLAIVEQFAIEPGAGLNVLTGETGAGKSLLIDSLEFLSGARGSTDSIRTGAEKMSAEAVFQIPSQHAKPLEELGVDVEVRDGSAELIVKRDIASNGRGRVLINGSVIAVRELLTAMERVLEIHGQDLSREKIAGQTFREMLDLYGGHDDALEELRVLHGAWQSSADELETLREAHRDRSLRLDLLKYQIDEIAAARLAPNEEETLRAEKAILANAQEMIEATSGAYAALEDDEAAALSQIARAVHLIDPLSRKIDDLRAIREDLEDVRYRLQEISRSLATLSESVRHNPARLEEVEERLVTIERLKKKYGDSIDAITAHYESIVDEHTRLTDYESSLVKLEAEEEKRFAVYRAAAEKLSAARKNTAERFQRAIQSELADLAMERTTVRIDLSHATNHDSRLEILGKRVAFGPEGFDRIEILIAPNRGEELRSMTRIASGGELSRMQLAIAAALFKESDAAAAATLVFDEIDAGIGGRVAEVVGRKLRELAHRNQVICVTHLPQIASLATTHFRVWKDDVKGRTRACIERLDEREARIDEIARMLGGEKITDSARAHAIELLEGAERKKRRAG